MDAPPSPVVTRSFRAFTLIELLVVVVIIAVLIAIAFPVLASVRNKGRDTQCISNLRQIVQALLLYGAEKQTGELPPSLQTGGIGWKVQIADYVQASGTGKDRSKVWFCPASTIRFSGSTPVEDQCTYSANARVLIRQNDPASASNSLVRVPAVAQPSRVAVIVDATQRSTGSPGAADAYLYGSPAYYLGTPNPANAEVALPDGPDLDGDAYRAFPRWRHGGARAQKGGAENGSGALHAAFLDGHVEAIRKGQLKEKHFAPNY